MSDVEVRIDLDRQVHPVGLLRHHVARRGGTVTFEYEDAWLNKPESFSLELDLAMTRDAFRISLPHMTGCQSDLD